MMKKLLYCAILFFLGTTLSLSQSTTYSFSHTAANELVIGTDGNFYNKNGSTLTSATVTWTCLTDYSAGAFDNYKDFFVVIKDEGGSTNAFTYGGLRTGDGSNTVRDATTNTIDGGAQTQQRTWVRTSIPISAGYTPVAGQTYSLRRSGGQTRDASNVDIGTTTYDYVNIALLVVDPSALGNKDFNKTKLATYYNASKEAIVVDNAVSGKYEIYNLLGQSVKNGEFSREISVSSLKSGLYILASEAGTLKFAK